ncbi:hypothetical protein JHK87_039283 [Glycine soja]|nr:hypothetical protein JHK87_039283 [Glycine soja]
MTNFTIREHHGLHVVTTMDLLGYEKGPESSGFEKKRGGGSDKGTTEVKVFENDGLVRSESDDSDEANDVYLDDSEDGRDLGLDDDATLVY